MVCFGGIYFLRTYSVVVNNVNHFSVCSDRLSSSHIRSQITADDHEYSQVSVESLASVSKSSLVNKLIV